MAALLRWRGFAALSMRGKRTDGWSLNEAEFCLLGGLESRKREVPSLVTVDRETGAPSNNFEYGPSGLQGRMYASALYIDEQRVGIAGLLDTATSELGFFPDGSVLL
jgi:hypothetical protein